MCYCVVAFRVSCFSNLNLDNLLCCVMFGRKLNWTHWIIFESRSRQLLVISAAILTVLRCGTGYLRLWAWIHEVLNSTAWRYGVGDLQLRDWILAIVEEDVMSCFGGWSGCGVAYFFKCGYTGIYFSLFFFFLSF